MRMQLSFIAMTAPHTSSQAIFKQQWQQAISHLSKSTRNSIIADVIDFQLTGRIPISMSKMRRALFNSFILEIDPNADISVSPLQNSMDDVAENETPAAIETVKASKITNKSQKKHVPQKSPSKRPEYTPVEKSLYSEEAAVYGSDVPDYFVFPDDKMLGRFINDPSGYGCLVDNEVPEFTVPLSEVRNVVAEWIDRRRGFLDYRQFRDRLLRVFRGDRMQKYRKEHPIPVAAW